MAVGLVSQVCRVRSEHPVTTNMRTMARPATMASVFMVYRESLLRVLLSMLLGSLAGLDGMLPMLDDQLVRLLVVSNLTKQADDLGTDALLLCNRRESGFEWVVTKSLDAPQKHDG